MLMGAVANLRPDLFAAIVAEVPFVDCLTTILDESLPLTVTEWEEWGNPVDDPERSEEHTSELQSLMRISYAVFCLKKTTPHIAHYNNKYQSSNTNTKLIITEY